MNPETLPIYELCDELIAALQTDNRLIIEAPTGSGKSTQVPQMLLDSAQTGLSAPQIPGDIVVLQPRRLAARLLARRVAHERGVEPGGEVGYQVRFENCISGKTRIRYVTEGILLRQILGDPELRGVSTVIFDEFHERHLYGDITLARCLHLQKTRPDLKLIVMSATLDAGPLREALAPCRELTSAGRMFPVDIQYASKKIDFDHHPVWEAAADAFERAIRSGAEGDVLIFMPGAYEISRTVEAVRSKSCAGEFSVLPLHGSLPPHEQDAAVGDCPQRKVVVATNVAETSITIDGICVVIDSGLARIARYDPRRGIDTLMVERISRASADQRAGRAGRTAPGVCHRLWTLQEQSARRTQELPEILRHDLSEVVLTLKAGGIDDLNNFQWLEKPDPVALDTALTLLTDLGAITPVRKGSAPPEHTDLNGRATSPTEPMHPPGGRLTEIGKKMVHFPMHPRYARMLLAADDVHCVRQACLIAALTQGKNLLERNKGKAVRGGRDDLFGDEDISDFKRLMRAWVFADKNGYNAGACRKLGVHAAAARQVKPLYERFLQIAEQQGLAVNRAAPEDEQLQKCILIAFSDQLAKRCDRGTLRCELVHGRTAELARESVVRDAELFVAAEIAEIGQTRGQTGVVLNLATAVEWEWLEELFPGDFRDESEAKYDQSLKRVIVEHRTLFRDLVLDRSITQNPGADEAAAVLAAEVLKGHLDIPGWNDEIESWILRVNLLAEWCPDKAIPKIDDDARRTLLEALCLGAVCRRDLREANVKAAVRDWLTWEQQQWIEKEVPERLKLPTGHRARIRYEAGHKPVLSAMIQDFFGMTQTPRIAFGRMPLVVELLAPNRRPVQITEDLDSFWRTAYPELRPALSRRYPKHRWE
jgi:ATP-dependent helicase HrpB